MADWPIIVARGEGLAKIYATPSGKYEAYTVCWKQGRRRQRKYSNLAKAKAWADTVAWRMHRGELSASGLSAADGATMVRVKELLTETGKAPELAAAEYAEAIKRIWPTPLSAAVDAWIRAHPPGIPRMTPRAVLDEMLAQKRADGLAVKTLAGLEEKTGRFAAAFQIPLAEITGNMISVWLNSIGGSPRTRINHRKAVSTLVSFASARRYLPPDWRELEDVPTPRDAPGAISILTPDELRRMIDHAGAMRAFIVLAAFTGIRHWELRRLDWRDVGDDWITVSVQKVRTAGRRLVPVLPALAAWLPLIRRKSGPICKLTRTDSALAYVARVAGVAYRQNALRHSWVSYRVADTGDVARTALEAGNSAQKIHQHYRELVTPAAARAWFSVLPPVAKRCKKTAAP